MPGPSCVVTMTLLTGIRTHPIGPVALLALAFVFVAYAVPFGDAGLATLLQNLSAVFVHLTLIAAALVTARRAALREERRFWILFAAGFSVWMLLDILPGTVGSDSPVFVVEELQ